jgi:hypothetical protein
MKNTETVNAKSYRVLNALEVSFPEDVEAWKNSKPGKRPNGYMKYKQERINNISRRVIDTYPEYSDSFKVFLVSFPCEMCMLPVRVPYCRVL